MTAYAAAEAPEWAREGVVSEDETAYLTGASNDGVLAVAHREHIGLMATPAGGYRAQLDRWPYWAADNGCFAQGDAFDIDAYLDWLAAVPGPQRLFCLFAVAPDVIQNGEATLARSLPAIPRIRALGYRAALVAQNGLTAATCPWGAFDVLFLGGDDAYKLGPDVWALCEEAQRRGVPVHMGRVNSLKRLHTAAMMGCATADGTYLKYGPDVNLPKLLRWLHELRQRPTLFGGYLCA